MLTGEQPGSRPSHPRDAGRQSSTRDLYDGQTISIKGKASTFVPDHRIDRNSLPDKATSMQQYSTTIRPGYIQLRSMYLGAIALSDPNMRFGRVTVLLKGNDQFSVEGSLNPQGYLTGMAKLYRHLNLSDGTAVLFSITTDGNLLIHSPASLIAS